MGERGAGRGGGGGGGEPGMSAIKHNVALRSLKKGGK